MATGENRGVWEVRMGKAQGVSGERPSPLLSLWSPSGLPQIVPSGAGVPFPKPTASTLLTHLTALPRPWTRARTLTIRDPLLSSSAIHTPGHPAGPTF